MQFSNFHLTVRMGIDPGETVSEKFNIVMYYLPRSLIHLPKILSPITIISVHMYNNTMYKSRIFDVIVCVSVCMPPKYIQPPPPPLPNKHTHTNTLQNIMKKEFLFGFSRVKKGQLYPCMYIEKFSPMSLIGYHNHIFIVIIIFHFVPCEMKWRLFFNRKIGLQSRFFLHFYIKSKIVFLHYMDKNKSCILHI